MPAGDEKGSGSGEAGWIARRSKRPGVGHRDAIVFVQFARTAIVEQAEGRVAMLLNFGEHDTGADGMDGAGGNEDDVAWRNAAPVHQFDDRTIPDRGPQFLRRYPVFQSDANLRAWFYGED